MAMVDGLTVEVADLPGDRARRALVLLHEGLGSVGLWRGFPDALHEATGISPRLTQLKPGLSKSSSWSARIFMGVKS